MAAVLSPGLEMRQMQRSDLPAVHAIEKRSYPFPWTQGIFLDCLRVGYRCRVLTEEGVVRGYSVLTCALTEAHLLNICIHPDRRRCGLASTMLDGLLREANIARVERMFLEVRPSNRGAIKLYRQAGFRVIGRRPGYYPAEGGREDAVVMVRHFGDEDD